MNIFVYPNGYVRRENTWEGKATINFVGQHWAGPMFIYRQIIIEIENMPVLNIDLSVLTLIPDHHELYIKPFSNNDWEV